MYLVLIGCSHVHVKIKTCVLYPIPSPTKYLENMSGTLCPCNGEMEKCDVCNTRLICHRCVVQCDCNCSGDACVWSCDDCLEVCDACEESCCPNCVSNARCYCGRYLCHGCTGFQCGTCHARLCGRVICHGCTFCTDCIRECEYCGDYICQGCAVRNKSGDSCHEECLDKRLKDIAVELGLTSRSIEPRNDPLHRADGGGLRPDMTDLPSELRRFISKQAETQFSMLCI